MTTLPPPKRPQATRLGVAAALAAAAAEQRVAADQAAAEDEPDEDLDDGLIRDYWLIDALGKSVATAPPAVAYWLTIARGATRFGGVNLLFAATGSLAATLAYSAAANMLLVLYARQGPKLPPPPAMGAKRASASAAGTSRLGG